MINDKNDILTKYGLNPEEVGYRPRGYYVITNARAADEYNVPLGTLVVETRDGGLRDEDDEDYEGPIDEGATQKPNFLGTEIDYGDSTYRLYFYAPVK